MLSPSCFAVCGHHLSLRIKSIFSLLSSVPYFSMLHSSIASSVTHPVAPCTFHIVPLCEFSLYYFATKAHLRIFFLLLPTTGIPLLSGRSRSPTRNRSFSVFTKSVLPCNCVFIPISSLTPPYIFQCSSFFTLFLSACLSLRSIISFISVLYAQTYLWT